MMRQSERFLIPGSSFFVAVIILLISLLYLAIMMLTRTEGVLVYCLDDTYIHLAIARTLQSAGVFGVHPDAVNFASSSLVWPVLLAIVGFIPDSLELQPLILNIFASVASLWLIEAIGKREGMSAVGRFMVMFFFIIGAPIPTLVYIGIEHVLHIFTVLLVVYFYLGDDNPSFALGSRFFWLCFAILASVLVRYESLAIAGVIAVAYLQQKAWKKAVWVIGVAIIPLIAAGVVMISYGGFILPNSLMMKGPELDFEFVKDFPIFLYYHLFWPANGNDSWRLLYVVQIVAIVLFLLPRIPRNERYRALLLAWPLLVLFQLVFVRHDQFARYSPYIVGPTLVLGLIGFMKALHLKATLADSPWTRNWGASLALLAVIVLAPFIHYGIQASRNVPLASQNIYDQQYQMGSFLSRYYRGTSVAVNDLGLPTFRGHVAPVDLVGLADARIVRTRRAGTFNTDSIRAIARDRHVELAVVYDFWLEHPFAIPSEWERIERWVTPDNFICGGDTVTYWAVRKGSADTLRARLARYRPSLPSRVTVLRDEGN